MVAGQGAGVELVEDAADEGAVQRVRRGGQRLGWGVPVEGAVRIGQGEHAQRQALAQADEQLQPVVEVGRGLGQGVAASLPVRLDVGGEAVARRRRKKVAERRVGRKLQRAPQFGTLHPDERFAAPLAVPEQPAQQHLFGRVAGVAGTAVEFGREVARQRLDGAHTVAVDDEQAAEPLGLAGGQGGGGQRRGGAREQQGEARQAAPQQRMAQQGAELAARGKEHPDQTDEEQGVAGVREGPAPAVDAHLQVAAAAVGVVRHLVQAGRAAAVDLVHGDGGTLGAAVGVADGEVADVVGRGLRAGVAHHVEVSEFHRGRERGVARRTGPVELEAASRLPHAQVELAPGGGERRGEGAQQDDDEGEVEHHGVERTPPAQEEKQRTDGQRGPKDGEPPRSVDMVGEGGMAERLFDEGSCRHDGDEHVGERKCNAFGHRR